MRYSYFSTFIAKLFSLIFKGAKHMCGFPLAEESKEAENVFLTHGWESG